MSGLVAGGSLTDAFGAPGRETLVASPVPATSPRRAEREDAIAAKGRQFPRAVGSGPVADLATKVSLEEAFVNDEVGRLRPYNGFPRPVGAGQHVVQRFGEKPIPFRPAAAVPVDEAAPVPGRVEHVADVECRVAERHLQNRR